MNIETLVEGTPDQGLYYKKGGLGVPDLLFTDFNGTIILRTIWNQVNADSFAASLDEAKRRFDIYLRLEEEPDDPLAIANATLLDLLVDRREVPMDELLEASKVEGVAPFLLENFKSYQRRKPILDLVDAHNVAASTSARDDACRKMFELYKSGVRMDDWKDKMLFVPYWRMAFDGALRAKDHATAESIVGDFEAFADRKRTVKVIAKTMREDLAALSGE